MTRLMMRMTIGLSAVMIALTALVMWALPQNDNDTLWLIYKSNPGTRQEFGAADVIHAVDLERGVTVDLIPGVDDYFGVEFLPGTDDFLVMSGDDDMNTSTYRLDRFNPKTGEITEIFSGEIDQYARFSSSLEYGFRGNTSQNPTHYTLTDLGTQTLYIIEAATNTARPIFQFTASDDPSAEFFIRVAANWSPNGDRLAVTDTDGTLFIMDIDGTILNEIPLVEATNTLRYSGRIWLEAHQLFVGQAINDGQNENIIIDLRTERITRIEHENFSFMGNFCEPVKYLMYDSDETGDYLPTLLDLDTNDTTTVNIPKPDEVETWDWATLSTDCEHIVMVDEADAPPGLTPTGDRNRTLAWHNLAIADLNGENINYLGPVGNFNRWENDLIYVVLGEEPDTLDLMRATYDAPDQPERLAVLPMINARFYWHGEPDSGYLYYTEANGARNSSFVVYDISEGREVYRSDPRFEIQMFFGHRFED